MKKRERIFIGIPCYQNVAAQTLEDYMRFAYHIGRRMPEYDFYLGIKTKSEQFRARNQIVQHAMDIGSDWLLMIDDDHIINTNEDSGKPGEGADCYDFLKTLLSHDVDIVGPIYYQRGGQTKPVVMKKMGSGFVFMDDSELTGGLQKVGVQGGGCILVRMSVFDKLQQPWFEPEHTYGTDIQLCKAAASKGFEIYTDSSIEIGHVLDQRVIISSKNKNQYRETAAANSANNLAAGWQAESVLNQYKYDAMRYLGVTESSEMVDLFNNYEDAVQPLIQKYGLGTEEYYAHMGREQLGRQVMYHFSAHPKAFMSFVLQLVQTASAATAIDFGCGSSPTGFDITRRGHNMYFHDLDGAAAYEFLKWRIKEYGIEDRAHFNVWPEDNTCAYALFLDSIEHLEDWKTPLLRAIRCLKPYGSIITNFVMLAGSTNGEHVFMDKGEFMKFMTEQSMFPITSAIFQKREL
jgi:hypothetical protein